MEFSTEGPMAIPLWINGHAFLTAAQDFFDIINPETGEATRRVPLCGAAEAAETVAAARAAQPAWAALPAGQRASQLAELAAALDRYTGHFAKLLRQDQGGDEAAATAQVVAAVAALRAEPMPAPAACCGVVLDAGQPLANFAVVLASTAAAGGTLVVKPSPKAPSAVFALCELTARAGWPAGVVNLLQGDVAAIAGLCAAGVDCLHYVGNPALGEQVGQIAAAAGISFVAQAA